MRFLLLLLIFATPCFAQFDVQTEGIVAESTQVYNAAAITSSVGGTAFYFPRGARGVILELDATYNSGSGATLDVKLQHSSDGTVWYDVPDAAFTQVGTASAKYEMHINRSQIKLRPRGRVYLTLAGTSPNYDATVTLLTD